MGNTQSKTNTVNTSTSNTATSSRTCVDMLADLSTIEYNKNASSMQDKRNTVLKELYTLSNMTLSYIEVNCNNYSLITDIRSIKKCHTIEDCILNNFKICDFEVSLIALIVEYCKYVPFKMSNKISDRSHCDGARHMDLIDTTFIIPSDGMLKEWYFYARVKATLYGTVWRCVNIKQTNGQFNNNDKKPQYKLISIIKFPEINSNHSTNRFVIPANTITEIKKGDFIGIRWDGHSSIPSAIGNGDNFHIGHIVHWSTPTPTPKIGEVKTFSVGNERDYAYGFLAECYGIID
eukprot:422374_1